MLDSQYVLQKYLSFDYRVRYLANDVAPSNVPEPGTAFAVENGLAIGKGLACDALHRPLVFETEAAAFSYRRGLGLYRPVLVFSERDLEEDDMQVLEAHSLDPRTSAELAQYLSD